jgi:hypothetical protein
MYLFKSLVKETSFQVPWQSSQSKICSVAREFLYLSLKRPGKGASPLGSPSRFPMERAAHFQYLFYISLKVPKEQGLLLRRKPYLALQAWQRSPSSIFPLTGPCGESCTFTEPSFTYNSDTPVKKRSN